MSPTPAPLTSSKGCGAFDEVVDIAPQLAAFLTIGRRQSVQQHRIAQPRQVGVSPPSRQGLPDLGAISPRDHSPVLGTGVQIGPKPRACLLRRQCDRSSSPSLAPSALRPQPARAAAQAAL